MFQHATSHAMQHNVGPGPHTAPFPPVSPQLLTELENLQHMALNKQPAVSSVGVFCDVFDFFVYFAPVTVRRENSCITYIRVPLCQLFAHAVVYSIGSGCLVLSSFTHDLN